MTTLRIIVATHETKHGVDVMLFATEDECKEYERTNVEGEWHDEYFNWDWRDLPTNLLSVETTSD